MTTLVSDSFNRGPASSLGTADTGQVWANFPSSPLIQINSSNQAQAIGDSGTTLVASVNSGASDYDVSVVLSNVASNANAGLIIRTDGVSQNGYFLRINGTNYEFYIYGLPSTSKLASQATGLAYPANNVTLRLVAQGSTITAYANGTQLFGQTFTTASGAATTNTYAGLRSIDANTTYDNFVVNSVGGGTPTEVDASATGSSTGTSSASGVSIIYASATGESTGTSQSTETLILYATATGEATGLGIATTAGEIDASATGSASANGTAQGVAYVYASATSSSSGGAVANAVVEVYGSAVGESSGASSATPSIVLYASATGASVGDSMAIALQVLFAEAIGETTGMGLVNNFATIVSAVKILGSFGVKQSVQGSFQVKHSVKGEV